MNFKKPPVVEAWIAFKFDLSEESTKWDENKAESSIKEYFKDFKPESFSQFVQVRIDAKTKKFILTPDSIFDRIRAFTEQKDYCVQAGRDIFILNQIKKDDWPSFDNMRDRVLEEVQKYIDFRGLDDIATVSLHYRNIISIPRDGKERIDLKEFFHVYTEMPERPFGVVSGFNFSVKLDEACEKATTTLTLQSLQLKDPSDDSFKFAMDWHVTSTEKIDGLNFAKKWLNKAHQGIYRLSNIFSVNSFFA